MGQNQRRPAFRLRWGEATPAESEEQPTAEQAVGEPVAAAADAAAPQPAGEPAAAAKDDEESPTTPAEASPFLRDLVGAMRGVAETSRDASLAELRTAVDARIGELKASAGERAEELRRRADLDVAGIGDWERSEIERIRGEAEQRREARRAQLEQQLADHQSSSDREVEAMRHRLDEHERELAAFFAQLAEITDPAAFVAAAKRMPRTPDLRAPAARSSSAAPPPPAPGPAQATTSVAEEAAPSGDDSALAERLAQLDERLAAPTVAAEKPAAIPTGAEKPAATAVATALGSETSTPIVVKGLGSFGAITSFKQSLERVDGIRGVTLSLGPTGEFVYRASHAADFDLVDAIRGIEGPAAGIEQSEGSVLVTIERPR